MSTPGTRYTCRYCRLGSDFSAGTPTSCPRCGAPVDVTSTVCGSGWEKQPAIADMARIQFGHSTVQIEGKFVPTADFRLSGQEGIYFSHHSVLWVEPTVQMTTMPMAGGWDRVRAGLPLVMLEAGGQGHIALSEDAPGEILAIPLQPGQGVWVREHRFLSATKNVAYTWQPSNVWITTGSGNEQETHYPLGAFADLFSVVGDPGLLLLHSPGNTFIRDLGAGETICVQPSSLVYKDPGVGMQLHIEYPNAGRLQFGFGSAYSYRNLWLRLWGPGRVAVQSVFERPEQSNTIIASSPATTTAW